VRSGEFEGAATDCGDRESPPLSLRLLLAEAQARGAVPTAITLYTSVSGTLPALDLWAHELGIEVRDGGSWDWRKAPPVAGISLVQERQAWRIICSSVGSRLRPAAWVMAAALMIHTAALVIDWSSLANEQRGLRQQMESRFRAVFPDAVAVVDPALQMRRMLATARHAAGQPDNSDFLPMIVQVAAATKALPATALRSLSYASGGMTLELASVDEATVRNIVARLLQSGLSIDTPPSSTPQTGTNVVLSVRAL